MIITIQGTGIELTEAIRQYAEEKIGSLTKFFDNITQANIDVGKRTNHHKKGDVFYAEVNMSVPGHTERMVKEADDLYAAIDLVHGHLKEQLTTMKEKMRRKDKEGLRGAKGYDAGDEVV